MTPTPEKIEKIMVDMLMTPTDWKQTIAINQLLDAHYALEERVGRLEKNQYPDTKPFPEYRVRENDICMKCGKAKFGNIFHECTSPKA